MIRPINPPVRIGETRVVRRFAWWPERVPCEVLGWVWVWWQPYWVKQKRFGGWWDSYPWWSDIAASTRGPLFRATAGWPVARREYKNGDV